jgi:hypothetical protein
MSSLPELTVPFVYQTLLLDLEEVDNIHGIETSGEEADYLVESCIEFLSEFLDNKGAESLEDEVCEIQSDNYVDLSVLFDRIANYWLEIPEQKEHLSGMEIIDRSAEFLGKYGALSGEPIEVNKFRIQDEDFRMRLWGAYGLCAMGTDEAKELLKKLTDDEYEDDNGNRVVAEVASKGLA